MNMDKLQRKHHPNLLIRFEKWTEIPLIILVFIMMATIIIPLVIPLAVQTHQLLEYIDWAIWAIFAIELSIRTYLSINRIDYLKKNWIDVIIVLLPLLRVFRLLRATRLLRILRFGRILVLFGKFTKEIKTILSRNNFHYLLVVLVVLIAIGTILIYHFDQGIAGGNVSLVDSLWLSIVNAISGGFANVYPAGPEARGVSVFLILVGTVIVSYFTASLAAYFSEKEQDVEQERIEQKLDKLIAEVKEVEKLEKEIKQKR